MVGLGSAGEITGHLIGSWMLKRQVDNGVHMAGKAVFIARADAFITYHEDVVVTLQHGQQLEAMRDYLFASREEGFAVYFAETPPRLFHEILLIGDQDRLTGRATHMCGDDRYDSVYVFEAGMFFTVTHRVVGPRKNYTMHTVFNRA